MGTPYVVPICFAYHRKVIYTPIDEKPKHIDPSGLRRVLNIEENPKVSFIADFYSEDWRKLRYVIVHGFAKIIREGEEHSMAVALLRRKYKQYFQMKLETRPIIRIKIDRIIVWSSNFEAHRRMREL